MNVLLALSLVLNEARSAEVPKSDEAFLRMSMDDLMSIKLVTATRVAADSFSLPFMTAAYGRQDFERRLPRTLPDWLDETPSVMVQKTAYGQASPYIRGFTGFRTLLLVDGVRVNNSTFREGPNQYWSTIDPLSLDRVEIIKGPGSVLYGSDAIGGTVNAMTLGGQPRGLEDQEMWRTFYRIGSAGESHIARGEFHGYLNDRTSLDLGVSAKKFSDLRGGEEVGPQRKSGYPEYDVDGKLSYFVTPHVQLVLAHQTVLQDDIWRTHSTIYGSRWEGLVPGTDLERSADQKRHLSYLQLHATELDSFVEQVHVSLSHHFQGEDQVRVRGNSRRDLSGVDVHSLGLTVQLESPSPLGRWVYGTTFYRDWVSSYSERYLANGNLDRVDIQGPVADDSTYDLVGAFVQNQLPAWGPLELTVRGRYDHAAADAGRIGDPVSGLPTSFSGSWNSFVGGGRALVHLDEEQHWNVFAGVGQGFRAPNLSDLTRFDIAGSGQIETPSTGVDPEYFTTYEAGIKTRYDRAEFEAAYFYTDIREMIVRRPTGAIVNGLSEVTKQNSGNGYVHGVELQGSVRVHPQWTVRAGFTWMAGEIDSFPTSDPNMKVREPVSRLMPMTGLVGLRWDHPKKKFWAEGVCTLAEKQDRLSEADRSDTSRIPPGGTPGYVVGTLRAGWRINKNASLTAALENVANTDYRIHGSGINESGRNLVLGMDVRF
ncbi:MAG TPA: TonB-dependent receptor [Methylomirabilota bacterium]|nr:TonB-dependent receptor [Methylomirabilota bacterium]